MSAPHQNVSVARLLLILFVLGLCCSGTGCQQKNSDKEREALTAVRGNDKLLAPQWFRNAYFATTNDQYPNEILLHNKLMWMSIALHFLLWIVASIIFHYAYCRITNENPHHPENPHYGRRFFLGGHVAVAMLCLVCWLLASMVVTVWEVEGYIPFDLVVFLTIVGVYVGGLSVGIVWVIHWASKTQDSTSSPYSPAYPATSPPPPKKKSKVVRAVVKAAFVAFATSIAGKLVGVVGGLLILVITTAVCAWFEVSPPDSDA